MDSLRIEPSTMGGRGMSRAMAPLRAEFLGRFALRAHDGRAVRLPPAARSLLAYLVFHRGHLQLRERVVDLFWKHNAPHRGRNCLASALWRARRALQACDIDPSCVFCDEEKDYVAVRREAFAWTDVDEVMACDRFVDDGHGDEPPAVSRLETSLALFRGELLEDEDAPWIGPERTRLHRVRIRLVRALIHQYREADDFEAGVALAEGFLARNPVAEEIHRELIVLHRLRGEPAEGLSQYRRCCEVMRERLGSAPSRETRALVEATADTNGRGAPVHPTPEQLVHIQTELREILTRVDALQREIHATLGGDRVVRPR